LVEKNRNDRKKSAEVLSFQGFQVGRIDWWRYGKEILLKKLIPFAK
jgi:hypothetical protein